MPLSQNSYTLILVLFFSLLPLVTHFHNMFAFCCCQYFDWYLVIFIIKLFAIAAYFIYYLCQYYFWPLFFIFYILQYYLPPFLTVSPNVIGPFFILYWSLFHIILYTVYREPCLSRIVGKNSPRS